MAYAELCVSEAHPWQHFWKHQFLITL